MFMFVCVCARVLCVFCVNLFMSVCVRVRACVALHSVLFFVIVFFCACKHFFILYFCVDQ